MPYCRWLSLARSGEERSRRREWAEVHAAVLPIICCIMATGARVTGESCAAPRAAPAQLQIAAHCQQPNNHVGGASVTLCFYAT